MRSKAVEIIKAHPEGIRWSRLLKAVEAALPQLTARAIPGSIWDLDKRMPTEVYKPERGLWQHVMFKRTEPEPDVAAAETSDGHTTGTVKEQDFYQKFADYLRMELEECTKAVAVGGNKFKDKWGTPDVVGVRKSIGDLIPVDVEVVSAEIKTETTQLITAFGQACAYTLFSHRSYLVVPRQSDQADVKRLEALCRIVGIGLILFDKSSPADPDFTIRLRASKQEPDMFSVNKNMQFLRQELFD
jgi:hypothetical protein